MRYAIVVFWLGCKCAKKTVEERGKIERERERERERAPSGRALRDGLGVFPSSSFYLPFFFDISRPSDYNTATCAHCKQLG
jgi:hypothetical protein